MVMGALGLAAPLAVAGSLAMASTPALAARVSTTPAAAPAAPVIRTIAGMGRTGSQETEGKP